MHELKQQLRMASAKEYEKNQVTAESENEGEKSASESRVTFTPGVIVKLPLDQHIKDVKSFKVRHLLKLFFFKLHSWWAFNSRFIYNAS